MGVYEPFIRMAFGFIAGFIIFKLIWFCYSKVGWQIGYLDHKNIINQGFFEFLKYWFAWFMAGCVYALIIETSSEPFTWYWLNECILKGDWIAIAVISTVLSLISLYYWRKRLPITDTSADIQKN